MRVMTKHEDRGGARDGTLSEALDVLERCCGTPVVPGELLSWLEAVETAFADLETSLRRQVGSRHRAQFEQIVRDDTSLQRPVDRLEHEDGELVRTFESLRARAAALAERTAAAEPDEASMSEEVYRFARDGLWFVISVRKQDTAIRTWQGEALRREHGAGD
jgi:hypothetical protein